LAEAVEGFSASLGQLLLLTCDKPATQDPFDLALQADYIPLDARDMEWDYLDADDDADTGLF